MNNPIKSSNMYKVSIGIPVYNVAAYVERALLSALNQTLPDIEYIIVDDRGTDNSMDIVRRVISEHPRGKDVRIIEQEVNKGVGAARDTMIANATAPYLYFMDSDDEIPADALERLYGAVVASGGAQVVQADYEFVTATGRKPVVCGVAAWEGIEILKAYCSNSFYVMVWNKLYDVDFLRSESIRFGDVRCHEDTFCSMQVACKAQRVVCVPYVAYWYYDNAASISAASRCGRYDDTWYMGIKTILEKMRGFCASVTGEKRVLLEQRILGLFYGYSRLLMQSSYFSIKRKRQYFGELDALFRTYPFTGKYHALKARMFWRVFQLPIPLRMMLIRGLDILMGGR